MKVKVSKVFANYVNNFVRQSGIAESAEYREVSPCHYPGGECEALFNGDFTAAGRCKVVMVYYAPGYYACPLALTTGELVREFRSRNVRDEAGLRAMLREMIEA